jgi:hypothetical protein
MSDEHKDALAEGRRQARAVRDYLEVLERERKPGRRLSKDEIATKLSKLEDDIASEPDPAKRVALIQRRLDYEDRLSSIEETPDLATIEAAFVSALKPYSERKEIGYAAWREAGVPAAILKQAGVKRTRRSG